MSLVPDKSVIVIGGGVCGLVAAHTLARAGAQVTLIEASGRVGGQVRSEVLRDPGDPGGFAVGERRSGQEGRESAAAARPDGVNAADSHGVDALRLPGTDAPEDAAAPDAEEVVELRTGRRIAEPPQASAVRSPLAQAPRVVEMGAEAVPLRAPGVAALVQELGLSGSMTHPRPGPSLLSSRRGPVPMPDGVTPTGPTRLLPTVRSQIISPRGLLRAAAEPLAGRRHVGGDVSVGEFIEARFGPQVARAVVDPLMGAIHAADINRFSLAAAAPALVETAAEGDSMLLATLGREARRAAGWAKGLPARGYHRMSRMMGLQEEDLDRPAPSPSLASWPQGTATLADHLAASVRVRGRLLLETRATRLTPPDDGGTAWRVGVEGRDGARELTADAVVVATGSASAAGMLADVSPRAAETLAGLRAVSVATVILDLPLDEALEAHPISRAATWFIGSGWSPLIRQVTNLSLKWPKTLGGDRLVLRVNAGRDGGRPLDAMTDDELARAAVAELRRLGMPVPTPVEAVTEPSEDARGRMCTLVARFPNAMPQPAPGHRIRMESLAAALSEVPGLALGGCATDGAGVGTAIVAGRRLARQITAFLEREPRAREERGGAL